MKYGEHGVRAYKKTINTPPPQEQEQTPLAFLEDTKGDDLGGVLFDEPPEVLAKILPLLGKNKKSQVMNTLSKESQTAVVKLLLKPQSFPPEEKKELHNRLKAKLEEVKRSGSTTLDGPSVLSNILKEMAPDKRQVLMKDLHQSIPDIARRIENRVVTLETFTEVIPLDRQKFLNNFKDEEIILLLGLYKEKGAELILQQLSRNRQAFIIRDLKHSAPPEAAEIQRMGQNFLGQLREGVVSGELRLASDDWVE